MDVTNDKYNVTDTIYDIFGKFKSCTFVLAYQHYHWWKTADLGFIAVTANFEDKQKILCRHYPLHKNSDIKVYYKASDDGFNLYISGKWSWQLRCICGEIPDYVLKSVDLPEDATLATTVE